MNCPRKRFRINCTRTQPLAVLLTLLTALLANVAYAQEEPPTCPPGQVLRAGVASFIADGTTCNTKVAGNCGIFVKFNPPLPAACLKHVVVAVQQTNDGAYSPTTACTYLNVLKITSTNFQVQHKGCNDGVPYPVTSNLEIGWTAISTTQ
jgi:hypothetical protein